MPDKEERFEENIRFRQIRKKVQAKIDTYLNERHDVWLNIQARSYDVTIIGFSNIDEKKYLQAKTLLNLLRAGVYTYKDLHDILGAAEADNAKLVKKTLYSTGDLWKALKECLALIPEELKNNTEPMRRVIVPATISSIFKTRSDSSVDTNNTSIGDGPNTSSDSSPLIVKNKP